MIMAITVPHQGTHTENDALPTIRKVDRTAPNRWLAKGIDDFITANPASLMYGILFVVAGALTIWLTQANPVFVLAIVTGFYLVGPPVAAGVYDMRQRIEKGEKPSLIHAISVLGNNVRCLLGMVFILGGLMLAWTVVAGILVSLFFENTAAITGSWEAITSGSQALPFSGVLFLGGVILALLASGVSLTFLPLLSQRKMGTISVLLILAAIMLAWVRAMVMAVNAFVDNGEMIAGSWNALLNEPQFIPFLVVFLLVGLVFAAVAFTISVVSVPLIIERQIDVFTAIKTSVQAVRKNPITMMRWAATIAVLLAVGMGFFFVGLAVVLPIIGHASWHAYREIIVEEK
jgi:uncharacterized membrane protein